LITEAYTLHFDRPEYDKILASGYVMIAEVWVVRVMYRPFNIEHLINNIMAVVSLFTHIRSYIQLI